MRLPKEKRDHLRQIDEELNDEPPAARARLWSVLDRYTYWLEHLDPKDRQEIESAPGRDQKLEVIKALREREWVSHLPRADRERIEQAPAAERPAAIEQLRQKERQRRAAWQLAFRMQGEPVLPRDLPPFWPQVRLYVEKSLIPTLSHTEREELFKAMRTSWPEHAQRLTALAEKHPIQVPPSERPGVVSLQELPKEVAQALRGRPGKPGKDGEGRPLLNVQGRWPNFAFAVERAAKNRRVALPDKPLGPCKPEEFVPPVQRFIDDLRKDQAAAKKLDEAQGKWPEFPLAVMELAKQKGRRVPGTFLPGPKEFWEKAKAAPAE
jgi:hypothetical protein